MQSGAAQPVDAEWALVERLSGPTDACSSVGRGLPAPGLRGGADRRRCKDLQPRRRSAGGSRSWKHVPVVLRSANRLWGITDARGYDAGFRAGRTLIP